jgi:Ca2+-binding EF-hand superfamily protein
MSIDINFLPSAILKAKLTSSPSQLEEAREAFEMYDKDRDDMITTAELIHALRALGYNANQVILERIREMELESDDGVGKLSFDEFLDFIVMYIRYTFSTDDMLEDFKRIDVDNDGKITKIELRSYLESLKIPLSNDEIDEIVNAADLDKDGSIDYKEFVIMMSPPSNRT